MEMKVLWCNGNNIFLLLKLMHFFFFFFWPLLCVSAWLSCCTSKPSPVVSRVIGLAGNLLRPKCNVKVGGSGHHLQGRSPSAGQSRVFALFSDLEQTHTCVSVLGWLEWIRSDGSRFLLWPLTPNRLSPVSLSEFLHKTTSQQQCFILWVSHLKQT